MRHTHCATTCSSRGSSPPPMLCMTPRATGRNCSGRNEPALRLTCTATWRSNSAVSCPPAGGSGTPWSDGRCRAALATLTLCGRLTQPTSKLPHVRASVQSYAFTYVATRVFPCFTIFFTHNAPVFPLRHNAFVVPFLTLIVRLVRSHELTMPPPSF